MKNEQFKVLKNNQEIKPWRTQIRRVTKVSIPMHITAFPSQKPSLTQTEEDKVCSASSGVVSG